ncbi:hypothetical protein K469DRAFT_588189, partial [Zopfia rhizophila CBS 207.26]
IIIIYFNNILIYTNGMLEEYVKYTKKVLQKLKKYKLYIQTEKYVFYRIEIKFLRYLKRNLSKSKEISKYIKLANTNNSKRNIFFLKFTNFYRKFIKEFLKIITLLIKLTKKDNRFN